MNIWYASIDDKELDLNSNSIIQSLLPEESNRVNKYFHFDDRKRSLLSILLQRALIRHTFFVNDDDYEVKRTPEGKPYAVSKLSEENSFKTWNYNVSHHGRYVCIVSNHHQLIGVDVVDISTRSRSAKSAKEFIDLFTNQLTANEKRSIMKQPNDEAKYQFLFIIWSLKEAYIKAIGLGLGFELQQIDFDIHFNPTSYSLDRLSNEDKQSNCPQLLHGYATARINNVPRPDWRFDFTNFDAIHVMTVAQGPLTDAIPSFRSVVMPSKVSSFIAIKQVIQTIDTTSPTTDRSSCGSSPSSVAMADAIVPNVTKKVQPQPIQWGDEWNPKVSQKHCKTNALFPIDMVCSGSNSTSLYDVSDTDSDDALTSCSTISTIIDHSVMEMKSMDKLLKMGIVF